MVIVLTQFTIGNSIQNHFFGWISDSKTFWIDSKLLHDSMKNLIQIRGKGFEVAWPTTLKLHEFYKFTVRLHNFSQFESIQKLNWIVIEFIHFNWLNNKLFKWIKIHKIQWIEPALAGEHWLEVCPNSKSWFGIRRFDSF